MDAKERNAAGIANLETGYEYAGHVKYCYGPVDRQNTAVEWIALSCSLEVQGSRLGPQPSYPD
jgi:hypothetical protein